MATFYNNGYSWYVQYRRDGRRVKERVGKIEDLSRKEVEILCKAKDLENLTGSTPLRRAVANTLEDFVQNQYLPWYTEEFPASITRTRGALNQHLLPIFGAFHIEHIPRQIAETYKHRRRSEGARGGTIIKELRILHAVLNRAVEWGAASLNPIHGIKPPRLLDSKPRVFYTTEQLKAIYEIDPLHAEIWRLIANTGLRRAEALNLRAENVRKEELRVISTEAARTKSAKWRAVPLNRNAKRALAKLGSNNGYVLPRMAPESLTRAFEKAAARAGLPGSLHALRHTYASHLVMAGVPIRTVQLLLGHASVTTTEVYSHSAPGHLQAAGRAINL